MHTMIDLTVYFLFFIACSSGAVFRKKGMEPDNDKTLPEAHDFRMEHDFFKVFEDMHLKMQEESETLPMYKKNRDSLFKTSFHESEDDDDNNDVLPSVTNSTDKATEGQDADPWSVIWYLGAFSGLITFFLVVTCSEWCCGNHLYTRHYGANHIYANSFTHTSYKPPETPPPPYHLFAPPSYNDSIKNCQEKQKPPKKSNIFIIPIHRIRRNSNT